MPFHLAQANWPRPCGGRRFDLLPGGEGLPYDRSRSRWPLAAVLGLGGLVCLAIAGWGIWSTFARHRDVIARHDLLLVLAGFVLSVAAGLAAVRTRLLISREGVRFERRGLLEKLSWESPLSDYVGVLRRVQTWRPRQGVAHDYELILKHGAKDGRDVKLYSRPEPRGIAGRQAHYCRLLGLPALLQGREQPTEVALEALEVPIHQRARSGGSVRALSSARVPGELEVRRAEAVTVLSYRPGLSTSAKLLMGGAVLLIAVAAVSAVPLFKVADRSLLIVGLLARIAPEFGFLLCGLAVALCRQRLRLSGSEAEVSISLAGRRFRASSVPVAEVLHVYVGPPSESRPVRGFLLGPLGAGFRMLMARSPSAVQIVTPATILSYGQGLSAEEKAWVRDLVEAVLAADAGGKTTEEGGTPRTATAFRHG